jgi:small-conductance mechanosensitive channel
LDFDISVAYKEDLRNVREILISIAQNNPLCLDEPEPVIIFKNFGESGIELLFGVWFEKSQYITVKNSVFEEIKRQFDQAGIEIPFPHRTIYTGSESKPLPISVKGNRRSAKRH